MFTFQPVDDLVDSLRNAGIRADVDPAKLNAPAVWVQPAGFQLDTYGSTKDTVRLVLIVPDAPPIRAYRALVDLLNKVEQVAPVVTATPRSVLMPDGVFLPGLEVPFSVRSATPEEPQP